MAKSLLAQLNEWLTGRPNTPEEEAYLNTKEAGPQLAIQGGKTALQNAELMGPDRYSIPERQLAPGAVGTQSLFEESDYNRYLREAEARNRAASGQQQTLASALQARIEGKAPSVAQEQLQRSLAQAKLAEQTKLAQAGRGLSPGLAAYLAAQNRARLESGTAGQAAILRAQEQTAAEGSLGTLLGQMRSAEGTQFGQAATAGLAQERLSVDVQEDQRKREMEAAKENLDAQQEADRLRVEQQRQMYENARANRAAAGSAVTEFGKAIAPKKAQGGIIQRYAEGGKVSKAKQIAVHAAAKKHMKEFTSQYGKEEGERIAYATMMKNRKKLAEGGECMAEGGEVNAAMGALTKMDNEANDTVPAMLSPGEIVIPRSIVASPKPGVAAKKFVEALLSNQDKRDAKEMALKAALGKKAVK